MKRKNIFIWLLIFFVLLIGVTTTLILKNRDWFYETVPYYCETSDSGYRKEEDVIEEKYSTGVSRYREGNSVSRGGTLFCLRKGVSLDVNMNVTIKKGSFKVAIYELGKDFNIQGKSPDQYLSEDRKVHEEEYTETGRTFVISTHIIEEATDLMEEVVMIKNGEVLLKENTQELLERSYHVSGLAEVVDQATEGYERHHEEKMGRSKSVTILLEEGQKLPEGYDVTIQPLNLEKLFVSLCGMEE